MIVDDGNEILAMTSLPLPVMATDVQRKIRRSHEQPANFSR